MNYMQKKISVFMVFSIIIVVFVSFTGCLTMPLEMDKSTSEKLANAESENPKVLSSTIENDGAYTFETETYQHKDIKILYPQVRGMEDTGKEAKINEMIRFHALSTQLEISHELPAILILDDIENMTYEVTLHTEKIISILFFLKGATKVVGFDDVKFYYDAGGLTINIDTLQIMDLSNFINNNKALQDKLSQSTNITNNLHEKVGNDSFYLDEYHNKINEGVFSSSDISQNEHRFFVTPTTIGIVIWVTHGGGDYMIAEIPR